MSGKRRQPRVLIYSHDSFGLGHLRRCRAIAHAICEDFEDLSVLILSGSPIIGSFDFRSRVDFVRVPGVIKLRNGEYTPLTLPMAIEDAIEMRASIIRHTAEVFDPDILIVDKEPLGLRGELSATLEVMKERGVQLVLGLRDVLDDPDLLLPEWTRKNALPAIQKYYDEIWVYGLPQICEPLSGLDLPASITRKITYTGYLQRFADAAAISELPVVKQDRPFILVTPGGGGDGEELVDWVLRAYESDATLPHPSLIVLGPFMQSERRTEFISRAAALSNVEAITFDAHMESLMARALGVVAMGGYNTFCEILSFDKRALIVPRTAPRREQLIRASRAEELGLITMLRGDMERDADTMATALRQLPQQQQPSDSVVPGLLDGLENVNILLAVRWSAAQVRYWPRSNAPDSMSVCFVLKGYPRLSETFIAQEILALETRGVDIHIASLRHPTDTKTHPVHRDIKANVRYLPEYLHDAPRHVFEAWRAVRQRPGYRAAHTAFRNDLRRDPTRNRVRRFGQACVLAHTLPGGTERLHAHFLHTPASVARYAALITGLPWSCSAHAKDIWTTPQWEIREKLAALDWLVTCTAFGADYLKGLAPRPEIVSLLYHGLDFARFPLQRETRPSGNGKEDPIEILSVGRAVAKKGYDDLLDALALLPKDLNWRFRHIGGGALLETYEQKARSLSIADRVEWLGPQSQETVLDALRNADIFALTSKVAKDGDRDGLPNVLMEAQSQALTVMATATAGIPELIIDGETGLLAPPNNPVAVAEALARLIHDPILRRRLGDAGMLRVRSSFTLDAGADALAARFGSTAQPAAA